MIPGGRLRAAAFFVVSEAESCEAIAAFSCRLTSLAKLGMMHRTYTARFILALLLCLSAGNSQSDEVAADRFATAAIAEIVASCEVCHGEYGASVQQQYPILAGQEFYYLYVQLKDFKSGLRDSPIMGPLASVLDKNQMQIAAEYFSKQSWPQTDYVVGDERSNSGLTVIAAGQCVACHLGAFHGNSRVPRLAGQHPEYLVKTMLDFKTKARNNSPAKGTLMASFDDDEIRDVAYYLSAFTEH